MGRTERRPDKKKRPTKGEKTPHTKHHKTNKGKQVDQNSKCGVSCGMGEVWWGGVDVWRGSRCCAGEGGGGCRFGCVGLGWVGAFLLLLRMAVPSLPSFRLVSLPSSSDLSGAAPSLLPSPSFFVVVVRSSIPRFRWCFPSFPRVWEIGRCVPKCLTAQALADSTTISLQLLTVHITLLTTSQVASAGQPLRNPCYTAQHSPEDRFVGSSWLSCPVCVLLPGRHLPTGSLECYSPSVFLSTPFLRRTRTAQCMPECTCSRRRFSEMIHSKASSMSSGSTHLHSEHLFAQRSNRSHCGNEQQTWELVQPPPHGPRLSVS